MLIKNNKIKELLKKNSNEDQKIKNCLSAFFFGGSLAFLTQLIYEMFYNTLKINKDNASIYTTMILILIAVLLTCFTIFDDIAKIAKAGVIIPITGFANSITSSALEGKSEGLIFGIGGKMFALIGSVTTYGIVSSIIFGFVYFLITR